MHAERIATWFLLALAAAFYLAFAIPETTSILSML
jgi:hypothetical protein